MPGGVISGNIDPSYQFEYNEDYLKRLISEARTAEVQAYDNKDMKGQRAYAAQIISEQNQIDIFNAQSDMSYNLNDHHMNDPTPWQGISTQWAINISDIDPKVTAASTNLLPPNTRIPLIGHTTGINPVTGLA